MCIEGSFPADTHADRTDAASPYIDGTDVALPPYTDGTDVPLPPYTFARLLIDYTPAVV